MSSGWIGQILHAIADQLIRFKCVVRFSQAVNSYHNVSVTIQREDGKILECDCMAGRGKCCSHTAGLLYKMITINMEYGDYIPGAGHQAQQDSSESMSTASTARSGPFGCGPSILGSTCIRVN